MLIPYFAALCFDWFMVLDPLRGGGWWLVVEVAGGGGGDPKTITVLPPPSLVVMIYSRELCSSMGLSWWRLLTYRLIMTTRIIMLHFCGGCIPDWPRFVAIWNNMLSAVVPLSNDYDDAATLDPNAPNQSSIPAWHMVFYTREECICTFGAKTIVFGSCSEGAAAERSERSDWSTLVMSFIIISITVELETSEQERQNVNSQ